MMIYTAIKNPGHYKGRKNVAQPDGAFPEEEMHVGLKGIAGVIEYMRDQMHYEARAEPCQKEIYFLLGRGGLMLVQEYIAESYHAVAGFVNMSSHPGNPGWKIECQPYGYIHIHHLPELDSCLLDNRKTVKGLTYSSYTIIAATPMALYRFELERPNPIWKGGPGLDKILGEMDNK